MTGSTTATDTEANDGPRSANAPMRVLVVKQWDDPGLRRKGHDPRSAYAERFWVPVLGPSAVWLLRLLAREFDGLAPEADLRLDLRSTAQRLGLQHRGGQQSTFMRTVDRCAMFGMARFRDTTLYVRRLLPPLPRNLHARLPRELRSEIGRWSRSDPFGHADCQTDGNGAAAFSVGETRLLASCVLMMGHGLHESAERLVLLGLAPRAANEATAWAWAERHANPPHPPSA